MTYEFKLPDIGEGLTEGEVVKWHVKEGDVVTENQPLCNVLTDKAEVEIPSPKTGKILQLLAKEGQKIKVHSVFVTFDVAGGTAAPQAAAPASALKAQAPAAAPVAAPNLGDSEGRPHPLPKTGAAGVNAMPAVRKLAGELKVDLAKVSGTGAGGRITEDDVRKASAPTAAPGPEEKIPFIGVRRRTAEKMAFSKRTVAHVTHMDEADFTALVLLREELKPEAQMKGVKLTYLPFIIRGLVKSLQEFPNLNASLDEQGGFVVRKHYYNIGIATAAEQGLVVPNIKKADELGLWDIAKAVNGLAEKVRSNRIDVAEISGGTFTITNIGPIGGLFATPIVNHPEVAILGVMKLQKRPMVKDGAVVVRDMVNLVLSFDHRVVDGAEGARFMNTLIKHLENPRTLL